MKKSKLLIWALIIADLLSGLLQTLQFSFYRVGLLLKGVIILALFIKYLGKLRDKSILSLYLSMLILFALWIVGFLVSYYTYPAFDAAESVVVLNRYLLFFVLAAAFLDWSKSVSFEDEAKNIFENLLIAIILPVLAGLLALLLGGVLYYFSYIITTWAVLILSSAAFCLLYVLIGFKINIFGQTERNAAMVLLKRKQN